MLPFVNLSGDKDQEYFSEGLTEEILNSLTDIVAGACLLRVPCQCSGMPVYWHAGIVAV